MPRSQDTFRTSSKTKRNQRRVLSGMLSQGMGLLIYMTVAGCFLGAAGAQEKLAARPPMGWNSWNQLAERIDDKMVRETADALVSTGLKDAGYIYLNIDDTWEGDRDATGVIHPNAKFPDMKALADYVHARGLKLGIYSSPGPKTCAGFEGSFNHEQQDATTWAGWGIDYIKYDWCSCKSKVPVAPYALLRRALDSVERDIVFSLCQY